MSIIQIEVLLVKIVVKTLKFLFIIVNLAKSKKVNLVKCKRSNLVNPKKSNFIKMPFYKIYIFTFIIKKTFIYLKKTYIVALFLRYIDPERYILIKTFIFGDAIIRILSQMILDQHFFNHVTQKNHSYSSESKICQ